MRQAKVMSIRNTSNLLLAVDKDMINQTHIIETELQPLQDNEVRLKVNKFALTSNTVTYGKIGTQFGYYNFYPSAPNPWGCVPAIGWASVVESKVASIPVGGKYFGWYPMSQYCTVEAAPSHSGFRDIGVHRKDNAQVYTEYIRSDVDPFRDTNLITSGGNETEVLASEDDYDDRQAILRGLFLTSFLADEYFKDIADELAYYNAKSVIIVSASSKTALGIAQRLFNKNKITTNAGGERLNVIGVTSASNEDFVKSTGFYDQTVTYDSIGDSICSTDSAVIIDMSGNWKVIQSIHEHLGNHIQHSMSIGLSHHDSGFAPKSLIFPGPKPTLFFAPSEVARRLQEWGPKEFHSRSKEALSSFITGSKGWMDVKLVHGVDSVQTEWLNAHDGKIPPNVGMMASMHMHDLPYSTSTSS